MNHKKNMIAFVGLAIWALGIVGCKKDIAEVPAPIPFVPVPPAIVATMSPAAVKDSMLLYSREIYLWNDQLPVDFSTANFEGPEALMKGIRQYSLESGSTMPADRWSFAIKKEEWDKMSAGLNLRIQDNHAVVGDFGFQVFFRAEGDLRVRFVEPNSPAAAAGLRRGWRVLGINGNNNMATNNAVFIIKSVYESASTDLQLQTPDGNTVNKQINAASYKKDPVYLDSVYQAGGRKVGYLVFTSFLGDEAQVANQLSQVIASFTTQGVQELIVDLRYNGGGYVVLQQKLANLLVPASADGSMMMQQQFNNNNSQRNSNINFQKAGALNLSRIYFIVGPATASASELLINNLKPYMDVRLIGPGNTHGKPVGYFPIPVGKEWYSFR
jgi:carboxyl-terminal processing protease